MIHTDDQSVKRLLGLVSPEPNTGCWIWCGEISGNGYGRATVKGTRVRSHRWFFSFFVRPLADSEEIDHICRVRSCCNPAHLRAVTRSENIAVQKALVRHCKHGHEITPENSYIDPRGWRQCKLCRDNWMARSRRKTSGQPNARKTHCHRGHAFDEQNTSIGSDGRRTCRECRRQRQNLIQRQS